MRSIPLRRSVVAPTDDAFDRLPRGTVRDLLRPQNRDELTEILTYHVVEGRVRAADAVGARRARTLEGDRLRFAITDGRFTVNGIGVSLTDIETSNGVIHVIDEVLLPGRGS